MSAVSHFDRAAPSYGKFSPAQHAAAQELVAILPTHAERVLEVGAGSGVLTRLLFDRYPKASFSLLDESAVMLSELDHWAADTHRVRYHCENILQAELEDGFDLIVSSSALHWVQPLAGAIGQIRRWLAPTGVFAASIMVEGTLAELYAAKSKVAPGKDVGSKLPTIESVRTALRDVGFVPVKERVAEHHVRFPSGRHLLQHLRATGVNGPELVRERLNKRELGALLRLLEGGIDATYRSYLFST